MTSPGTRWLPQAFCIQLKSSCLSARQEIAREKQSHSLKLGHVSKMQIFAFSHDAGIQNKSQTLVGQCSHLRFIEKTKHEHFSASLISEVVVEIFARRKHLFSREVSLAS